MTLEARIEIGMLQICDRHKIGYSELSEIVKTLLTNPSKFDDILKINSILEDIEKLGLISMRKKKSC